LKIFAQMYLVPVRNLLTLWFCCFCVGILVAQSPYQLKTRREALLLGGATLGIGASYALDRYNQPFMADQISQLRLDAVPHWERYATRQFSLSAKKASDIALISSLAVPGLLLLDRNVRADARPVATIVVQSLLLDAAITNMTKNLVRRPRPFCYNPDAPLALKLKRDARQSFFSGHTSLVATATVTTAHIWSKYHPNSPWKPVVWTSAFVLPATVGYWRIRAGKHYFSDVFMGLVVGSAIAWVVPRWHERNK
jgi:membrane-associated phospholipid phosphatase